MTYSAQKDQHSRISRPEDGKDRNKKSIPRLRRDSILLTYKVGHFSNALRLGIRILPNTNGRSQYDGILLKQMTWEACLCGWRHNKQYQSRPESCSIQQELLCKHIVLAIGWVDTDNESVRVSQSTCGQSSCQTKRQPMTPFARAHIATNSFFPDRSTLFIARFYKFILPRGC